MATEEEIRHLAHVIWEREGCPKDRADEHYWDKAKQFLENQEVAEAAGVPSLASLSNQLVDIHRTSEYYFRFTFAVAMMAIGTTLTFLTPPIIISGVSSVIIGSILVLLCLALIIWSGVEREPGKFHIHGIRWSLWIMLIGIFIIPVVALVNYYRPCTLPPVLQLVGLGAFVLGIYVAVLSRRRQAQEGSDVTERFPN